MFEQLENSIRNLKLSGHVGFDSLPDQLVNKSVQNGFVFNILCIGKLFHFTWFLIIFRNNKKQACIVISFF